jgi:hypothetical protein
MKPIGLKEGVRDRLTKDEAAIVRSALESQRQDLRGRMDRVWQEALGVERRIEASAGPVDAKLTEKMEALRRRHRRLADRGYAIELRLSELLTTSHRAGGPQWRPTAAKPF